jgi:2-keto-4-pentenoate hydratase/2-oxohepta-3-ene-1,7-dioic acid hydratase in catechol pathway
MKIIRYENANGDTAHAWLDENGKAFALEGCPFDTPTKTDTPVEVTKLLAPVDPPIVLGIGLNYKAHAEESGMALPERPLLFVKGANTVQHPDAPIEIPKHQESTEVDYECELAVVIGKPCKNVSVENALDYVLGYTCANDVSARDWQLKLGGGQWSKGKFFDTFAPLGPCLVTSDEITDPNSLGIRTVLNGDTVQDSNTSDMIFNVAQIVSFLSGSTTLAPGTVILTGTPQGVGMSATPQRYLKAGDTVTIAIDGIGELTNPVVDEPLA